MLLHELFDQIVMPALHTFSRTSVPVQGFFRQIGTPFQCPSKRPKPHAVPGPVREREKGSEHIVPPFHFQAHTSREAPFIMGSERVKLKPTIVGVRCRGVSDGSDKNGRFASSKVDPYNYPSLRRNISSSTGDTVTHYTSYRTINFAQRSVAIGPRMSGTGGAMA